MAGSFLFDEKMLITEQQKQRRDISRLVLGQIVSRTPPCILKHVLRVLKMSWGSAVDDK
jgi:hypothetical protein